jgi:hypothetical protein
MSLQVLSWILVGLFVVVDLAACLALNSTGPLAKVREFFLGVNTKLVAILQSILTEVEKNWQEYALLFVIYFLLAGLSLVVWFAYVLIGYLIFRLVQDITGVK